MADEEIEFVECKLIYCGFANKLDRVETSQLIRSQ